MPAIRNTKPLATQDSNAASVTSKFFDNSKVPAYPKGDIERKAFKTGAGKAVTPHQWAVYDMILNIPEGKVSTYKDICAKLGEGSPRTVGSALRRNPFAPYVPCHRVIAANHFVGGFYGEWGRDSKTGTQCDRKLDMLDKEGVEFSKEGYLQDPETYLW